MLISSKNRTTLKDIANMLGVSKAIVSKVLNNNPQVRVGKDLRQKILHTASSLNYSPLRSAQALTTKKTGQIAFLLSSQTTLGLVNDYYVRILAGVSECCRLRKYQCLVDVYNMSNIEKFIFPHNFQTRNIDGCILLGNFNDLVMEKFSTVDIPTIAIGGRPDKKTIPVITNDLSCSLEQMLHYFKSIDHHNIWLGYGNAVSDNTKGILEYITRKDTGMNIKIVKNIWNDNSLDEFEYGQRSAELWISLPTEKRPTLIYGSNQWCASFSSVIQRAGFKCPEDISIVAACDSELLQWHSPPITAYSNNYCYQYGLKGASLLLDILEGKIKYSDAFQAASDIKTQPKLIERDSVLNLKKTKRRQ